MIVKVDVTRAEGPNDLLGSWAFEGQDCEAQANAKLEEISQTAPDSGGYDKCDVVVTLHNGETITCRHDVQRNNTDLSVREHAERFLRYYATAKENWIEQKRPEMKKECIRLLELL